MEILTLLETISLQFAAALHRYPALQPMLQLLWQSSVVLLICAALDYVLGRRISSFSQHLIWLFGLTCLVLLPWLPAVSTWSAGQGAGQAPAVLFQLPVYATQLESIPTVNLGIVIFVLYSTVALILLSRLFRSLLQVYRLSLHSTPTSSALLHPLKLRLAISRKVRLKINPVIESPVSFGLFTPTIVLPAQSHQWNESVMTDVLLHELCHIKRLDWLTTLLAYVMACTYWINPLAWLAIKRLRDESENSCDSAVMNAGRSDISYAESLLGVATSCIHARRLRNSNPLLQTMLDQNTLKTRISRVLEENKMNASDIRRQVRRTALLGLLLSAGTLGILGTTQLVSAQPQPDPTSRNIDEEILPLNSVQPMYPTGAADESIEGWVHIRFTVAADGSVPEDSISVIEAEPAEIFNRNSIAAARQFRFSPRIVDGEPVDVPNVEYVFRFYMTEESEREAMERDEVSGS